MVLDLGQNANNFLREFHKTNLNFTLNLITSYHWNNEQPGMGL